MIFSCKKHENTLNDINEVDQINLQIGNKMEKLKLFFAKGTLSPFFRICPKKEPNKRVFKSRKH